MNSIPESDSEIIYTLTKTNKNQHHIDQNNEHLKMVKRYLAETLCQYITIKNKNNSSDESKTGSLGEP